MKKINLIIMVLFISTASAQEKDDCYLISYSGKFNSLFGRGESFRSYQGSLFIQGDQSIFTMKPLSFDIGQKDPMSIDLQIDSLFTVYKDVESNSLLFEFMDLDQRSHFFADTLHPMNWLITDQQKMINGSNCIMATASFKGRDYIAWYDPTVELSNGPWKLGGLPGLIMEAYDINDEWHLIANKISIGSCFDFSYHKSLLSKPIKGYEGYGILVKKILNSIEGMMSAQGSADCLTCETRSKLKVNTWEPIY